MAAASARTTIVGVFEDRHQADKAVADLMKAGFRQDQIGVAMRHDEAGSDGVTEGESEATNSGSGALAGALTGLGLGALAGLGVLAGVIPVVGPAIAAGTLGVVFSNAAAGAGIAGLLGALVGAGMPEHEAKFYHDEFEAGRTVVTVTAEGKPDAATAILREYGAYDMTSRASATSASVAAPATLAAKGATTHAAGTAARGASAHEGDTIQVKEERLHAEKRPVSTGEVAVRKEVHTETKTIEVPVKREEVVIERTAVHGRSATEGISASDIREGEQIRIPVSEERVTLSKDAVVVEEVKVGKRVVEETEKVSGQVRKEEVKIEQTGDVDVKTHGTGKATRPA